MVVGSCGAHELESATISVKESYYSVKVVGSVVVGTVSFVVHAQVCAPRSFTRGKDSSTINSSTNCYGLVFTSPQNTSLRWGAPPAVIGASVNLSFAQGLAPSSPLSASTSKSFSF